MISMRPEYTTEFNLEIWEALIFGFLMKKYEEKTLYSIIKVKKI